MKKMVSRIYANVSQVKTHKRIEYIQFEFKDIERSPIVKDILEIYGDS
jgi:hypothetical protein